MAQYTAYLLHFTAPLHLGNSRDDYGVSLQTLGSDGLYAALTATLSTMGVAIPDDGDLGCTVSSLFPFYQKHEDDEPMLFFPRPKSAHLPHWDDLRQAKQIKRVEWLDQSAFELSISGQDFLSLGIEGMHGKFFTASKQSFDESFMKSSVSQRVSIADTTRRESPLPFYMDRLLLSGNSGLFFLCTGDTTLVDKALPLLSANGIGTDRNVGNGFFIFEKRTISISTPSTAELSVSLSTYIPSSKTELEARMDTPECAYELTRLGGWTTTAEGTPLRRNPVHGFSAGSVFVNVDGNGAIVDQRPSRATHPVYRCGRAIMLPFKPFLQ